MQPPVVHHRHVEAAGLRLFYREAGPRDAPTLLLLHGFPSSSHQFRRLIDAVAHRYHVIAPDYPGFGFSAAPDVASFDYSFDALADVMEAFCRALRLERFVAYLFDFGAPVGFRLALRHPEWFAGLIVQNGNAYAEGLSPMARELASLRATTPGANDSVMQLLTEEMTRSQYLTGLRDPEQLSPESWTLDQHFLDLPGRKAIQVALALDYHSNVEAYPRWQAWLREHQPRLLVLWGRHDPFFVEAGAHAFLRDVPRATVHLLDTGHFALEEDVGTVAEQILAFMSGSA